MEIRLVDGHHYEIFAGPHADKARIEHHINVVRQIEGDITFTEMLARSLGARSGTEKGSIAADIRKLASWIAQQTLKLESSVLAPGERDAILSDIAVCVQRRDKLIDRLQELRNRPDNDRGSQPILLPDSTRGPSNRVYFIRTRANDLVEALVTIDPHEFGRAIRETGANEINDPERIIDWFVKNQKFAKRSLLGRALGLPDYEKVWQQFLKARVAAHSSDQRQRVQTLSPETRLVMTLADINPNAFTRATKELGSHDAGAVIDWFVKNEGLGTKNAYEQAWQKYLSWLAKERQRQQQPKAVAAPFPWQQPAPAVVPIPYEPGASAPGRTIAHDGPQTLQDAPPTIIQDVHGLVVVVVSNAKTKDLVVHLFNSIGDKNSPQAKSFIEKLRIRIEGDHRLTVGDFLTLVRYYAKGVFDSATADRIAHTMAQLSTNDPNVASSERLRDDYELNTSYLLGALR